jgi:hypothetical protein
MPGPGHKEMMLPMPDEKPTPDLRGQARHIELEIVYLLTDPEDKQPLWTVEDLARELSESDIMSYVHPLQAAGLVHRTSDDHIFASRAAVHQVQLVGHGVI